MANLPSGSSAPLSSPLIIDTDIGGDPDDTIAVAVAALRVPELALVITTDEAGGERARFARHLLDLAGRPEVPVVAGADLGHDGYFYVEGLAPTSVTAQPSDVVDAIGQVIGQVAGPVRWLGIGPMTNLARLLAARLAYLDRLKVTQMGGALAYRHQTRAEHNVRRDPVSALAVLTSALDLTLVPSDVTFTAEIEIAADSPIGRALADPGAPPWAGLLTEHLRRWYERVHPGAMQHDGLTLACALGHPSLDFAVIRTAIAADGRMAAAADGIPLRFANRVRYGEFMWWLAEQLDWTEQPLPR